MAKNTGGSAFPKPQVDGPNDRFEWAEPGMTLRDWFAGQALNAVIGNSQLLDDISDLNRDKAMTDTIAHHAYVLADAMLAERDK